MSIQHKKLAQGRWFELELLEQLANVGGEVERTISWKNKGNKEYGKLAFERCLELLDLTISDRKNVSRLKELTRLREALADYFFFDNIYNSSDKKWQSYFYPFNYAARVTRKRY